MSMMTSITFSYAMKGQNTLTNTGANSSLGGKKYSQTCLYLDIIVGFHRIGQVNLRVLFHSVLCLRYERFRSGRSSAQSVNNGVSQQLVTQVVKCPTFALLLMCSCFLFSYSLMSAAFSASSMDLHVTLPVRLYTVFQVLLSVNFLLVIYQMDMPN